MNIFVVYESAYDHYHQHGIFSEREAADAYIAMVNASEASELAAAKVFGELSIQVVELDALVGAAPVFTVYSAAEDDSADVFYGHLPQPAAMRSLEDESRIFEAYGRTLDEARANYRAAAAAAAAR